MSTLLNGTTPSMSPPNNSLDSIGLIIVSFELVLDSIGLTIVLFELLIVELVIVELVIVELVIVELLIVELVIVELLIVELVVLIVVGPFDVDACNVVVDSLLNINFNYYKQIQF